LPSLIVSCAAVVLALPSLASAAESATAGPEAAPASPAPAPSPAKPPEEPKAAEPFAYADWTWLNGSSRQTEFPLDGKAFSGEFSADVNYTYDFANPSDHSIVGSTSSGRSSEIQVMHLGAGGDLHWNGMRGRIMTQFGLYSTMTPRNDASPSRGQWDLSDAYRYVTEAYGGYHWDVLNGINVDAGVFLSYVGLESYYNFENWVYQASYVSSNTPWFFNGIRIQIFTSDKLKIEPWIINGWQSYGMFNEMPGLGLQVLWRPVRWMSIISNSYVGKDTLGNSGRFRLHSDDSITIKYFESPDKPLHRAAFSLTVDAGCETGGGVSCAGGHADAPDQYFVGVMAYNRFWLMQDHFGITIGGGAMSNPGRYLVLMPPINGATAASGTPYFDTSPGTKFWAWDGTLTLDWMPTQLVTFRWEYCHRWASVPYFSGSGGVTPLGGNQGAPGSVVANFTPDLQQAENRMQFVLMTRL